MSPPSATFVVTSLFPPVARSPMTSPRSAARAAPRTKVLRARTAAGAQQSYARLSTKASKALELAVDWAIAILEDEGDKPAEKWEKAQAMTFAAKLQHLIIPAESEKSESPIERFEKLMAEIRTVPKIVDDAPPGPVVTDDDDEELNEEEPLCAQFEAAPS